MIKQTILYIFKREAYHQYSDFKNSDGIAKQSAPGKLGKACLYLIWGIYGISFMYHEGFLFGLSVFIVPIALFKCISALKDLRKVSVPTYKKTPVYKSDNRFTTGQRFTHYEMERSGVRMLTIEELAVRKLVYTQKLYTWALALAISIPLVIYFSYTYKPTL